MTRIYSARWVLPVVSPAIEDGAVAIEGTRIVAVAGAAELTSRFPDAQVSNYGSAAILPGLVNTHSHLELTVMRGFLELEEQNFSSWLRKLTIARMAMTDDDLFVSAACGTIEAARAGITCVGDSSSAAMESMKALREVGLRGIVYQESFGPDPNLAQQNVATLREQIAELRLLETELVHAGVSPHAPYTVSAPQLKLTARLAIDDKLPLMMHAAESEAERQFMFEGVGPFAEGLKRRGIPWTAPAISSIEYLARNGLFETKPLLVHCVTVDDNDIQTIKAAGASIAHCPKSNAKLRHGRAPFGKFIAAGVNVGLGSDSVASNNNCDVLEEARFATLLSRSSSTDTAITAEQALFTATLGGARALGLDNQIGALAEGRQADLVVVGLDGAHHQPISDPRDALIFSSSGRDVRLTVVAGKEIYRDGRLTSVDEDEQQSRLRLIRAKLNSLDTLTT
jgi:cytosine/adenosine deaminase-related metal-dependent hydrolase